MPEHIAFGRPARTLWPLEPGATYLNHGTVGVTPKAVMQAQATLRERIEAQPARFVRRDLKPALRAAAEFDWTGTRDPTPFLCFPDAAAFMERLGPAAVREHSHDLVVRGARELFSRFAPDLELPVAMTGAMALAPLPATLPAGEQQGEALRDVLLDGTASRSPWWRTPPRRSIASWPDFERLADATAA